jgi:hypothetical protein
MRMSPAIPSSDRRARCPDGAARRDNSGSAVQGNARNSRSAATSDVLFDGAARCAITSMLARRIELDRSGRQTATAKFNGSPPPQKSAGVLATLKFSRRNNGASPWAARRPRFVAIVSSRPCCALSAGSGPGPHALRLLLDQREGDFLRNVAEDRADDQGDHADNKGVLKRGRCDGAELVAC